MSATVQKLLDSALRLSDEDRAGLAASLIESLDGTFDRDAQAAWAEEVQRRLADLDSGAVSAIPWDVARQAIAGHAHLLEVCQRS